MKPEIGISEKNLNKSIDLLSTLLSDEMALYIKTRKFHWNVSGGSFIELHQLFENHYKQLEKVVDEVAERINKLGGQAIGTMREFVELTRLKESPNKYPLQKDMMKELLSDHEAVIVEIRKDIEICNEKNKDVGTINFLTNVMEQHETIAWVLRRYQK